MKRHFLEILEVQHLRNGEVIWENKNILNTFHVEGELFVLSSLLRTSGDISVPSFYYLGLDNRTTLSVADNMAGISTEPSGNGYSRQPVSSSTGFTIEEFVSSVDSLSHWRAKSTIVSFSASGGSWGPVSNVFMTTELNNTGYLISSASLGVTRTLTSGDSFNLRFALRLI